MKYAQVSAICVIFEALLASELWKGELDPANSSMKIIKELLIALFPDFFNNIKDF